MMQRYSSEYEIDDKDFVIEKNDLENKKEIMRVLNDMEW
jgi:hypothetical protein